MLLLHELLITMTNQGYTLRTPIYDPTERVIMVIWVRMGQTEISLESFSKGPIRAIGKVPLIRLGQYLTNIYVRMMQIGHFCKQMVVLLVHIDNIGQ